jgi:cytochrome c-type biogenesis protein CcmH
MNRGFAIPMLLLIAAAEAPLLDPSQEAAARALMHELRCLVCQHQSIADSNADMAVDMRRIVRERIAAGEPPAAVRAYLVERYGDWVTFDPPRRGSNLIIWAAPFLFLAIGAIVAARQFRKPRT